MEAKHVIVIQRNHKFLKDFLIVDPVLDALLQEGVFTQEDYNNCRQAGTGKCEMLLEILKKKGVEGYRTMCGVLDSTQPFIKERLDATSLEGGNSDLVFVNKLKVQAEHRQELARKDEQIAELKSGMEDLRKQLEDKQKDYETLEETYKREREELTSQMEQQKEEIETLTTKLSESNHELQQCQKQCHELSLRLQEEKEAFELLSGLPTSQSADMEVMTGADQLSELPSSQSADMEVMTGANQLSELPSSQSADMEVMTGADQLSELPSSQSANTEVMTGADQLADPAESSRMCKLSTVLHCDDKQLYLLPCLHSVCKPCIDHHVAQAKQYSITCPCSREFRLEDTVADHVGRNETAYAARSNGEKKCDYLEEDHDAQAAWHCRDCDDYLCTHCLKLHNKVKRNRGHNMDEVGQTDPTPIKQWLKEPNCKDHPSNELQLYDHTCKKAICIVCLHGDHEHHKNEDLSRSYENTRLQLEEQLQKQRLKLKDVKDKVGTVNSHEEELGNTQRRLEQEVTAVSKRVAVKLCHRQRTLREEIQVSLDKTNKVVHENLDSLNNVQSSIESTIDYTKRALDATRREELITLAAVIQEKCNENLQRELPEDDTRDTSILLSFQGQAALEELINTFGGLASSLHLDHIPDSQLTLQGLHLQNNLLTVKNKVHEDRWHHLEQILRQLTVPDSSAGGSPEPFTHILTAQGVYEAIANLLVGGSGKVYLVGDSNVRSVMCPKVQLDATRANTDRCHVTSGGELVTTPPATQHRHSGRLREYWGTCASTPIPLPPSPSTVTPAPHTPQYWEAHSRVGVVRGGRGWLVLEVGVVEESQVDSGEYVCHQRRSWCVSVERCVRHGGRICTMVWQPVERGKCYSNTMSATPGTQATLHYGVVLDVGRGRLAFIDLDREVVLAKVDVEWRESLLPMFGVGPPGCYTVNMKVISGADITMTDTKKSLIYDALN